MAVITDCTESVNEIKTTEKWKQFCHRNERYIKGSICITIALIIFLTLTIHFSLKGMLSFLLL